MLGKQDTESYMELACVILYKVVTNELIYLTNLSDHCRFYYFITSEAYESHHLDQDISRLR